MLPSVLYHCPCLSNSSAPPPPHLLSSSFSFHPLHTLLFCEECDAVRCNRCVSVEVSTYYCPNCLFEVPSASVRAEKNRCARNCFMCPSCRNTLSVVPSDPPDGHLSIPTSTVGEPPFFLYCNHCRWDSAEVGITFEKPTGLASQLRRHEDSAPDSLEFDRLKDHFEPFLRASSLSMSSTIGHAPAVHPSSTAHSHHLHSTSITAAANAALSRDVPGVGKYKPLVRSISGRGSAKDRSLNKDEMAEYRSRLDISTASATGTSGGEGDVNFMRHLKDMSQVMRLEQRWENSWVTPIQTQKLKPLRIPLHSKRSKRCPACTHILIKPEQKAQSVKYKIKLIAANYLPAIKIALLHQQRQPTFASETAKRAYGKSAPIPNDDPSTSGMHAGRTYPFRMTFTNPLYDPIQVRLSVQRTQITVGTGGKDKARRPPFAISLPTSSFLIAPFDEQWDDEDDFGPDDGDDPNRPGTYEENGMDVLEKKANFTVVGGEVVIGKEANGIIKFNMLVSYTYRADDPTVSESNDGEILSTKSIPTKVPETTKTFAFYTVVNLGNIIPREKKVDKS